MPETFAEAAARIEAARGAVYAARQGKDWRAGRLAEAEAGAANRAALDAFAAEILPTVLAGQWRYHDRGGYVGPLKYARLARPLLDHVSGFLQLGGSRGRHRYACLAEPYEGGDLPTEPVLWDFPRYHYGPNSKPATLAVVPLGKSASRWFPGWTLAFVIAQPDLLLAPI